MKKWMIALFVLAAAAGLNSCGEFLDEVPDNRTEIDNMDKVKALLVSAYPDRYHETLEFRCDGIVDHRATYDGTQPTGTFDYTRAAFFWDEYRKIESDVDDQNYWFSCYKAIAAANHALAAIEKLGNPDGSETFAAEAKLCRAYAHFMLLTLFSDFFDEANRNTNLGIPYVTEPEDIVNKSYERGTVASTLEKIKEDLTYGLRYVGSAADYKQPKFHFSLDAARLLAMRIALYERDYPSVISYASMLVEVPSKFTTTGRKNKDGTDQILPATDDNAYMYCNNNLFDWVTANNTYSSSDAFEVAFQRATNANIILASEPYSLMSRAFVTNVYTRYTYSDETFGAITGGCANGCEWRLPKFLLGSMPAGAPNFVPKFYEDFKVTNINANTGQPYCRVALMRREEAILARAEAYTMMGDYDKALVDMTMYIQNRVIAGRSTSKANIRDFCYTRDKVVDYYQEVLDMDTHYLRSPYNAPRFATDFATSDGRLQRSLLLAVLDARRTEFLYEGYRWFDILRWNIPVTHRMYTGQGSTLTPDDDRRVLQLPSTVTLSDVELNPYDNIPNPWN